ncbi:Ies4p NDAI_0D02630 [Naumovozyma dairenensis CBS 421]|uniref:Uncharacterized protein n=1 Tax=Naumovozyma dairenensis (strain ATCC 10597 / BCRC 20456 / CBS 421 / NBRC 0211 / NRRL Y-12639) TaxID=1071378 RepID=G0W9W6_NAUDC|nr:hypothetical protein NDAI_0D02630 [Naumovozyma dairenensis CBS 421]CCD24577.1 hypothetical protein NDAI_0D02630 [Naumovozyma dairenensis CBS 421]
MSNTNTTKQAQVKKEESKPVLPWNKADHGVAMKTFTGYNVNLTGWIRKDIQENTRKRKNERKRKRKRKRKRNRKRRRRRRRRRRKNRKVKIRKI